MTDEHLLDRLDERYANIQKSLDSLLAKADNGGWNRCVKRGAQIEALEKDLKASPSPWAMKVSAFLGGFVAVAIFVVGIVTAIKIGLVKLV